MCGLAGLVNFDNALALAKEINKTQKHRGPDHQDVFEHENVVFAHQRLSIIDLNERSNQPFKKGNCVIVFNGEIYNYKELRQNLVSSKGSVFVTDSDTEVVLESYIHYGGKCLDKFIGMFSFAIFDISKNSIFIARDHFGIKPLFYTQMQNQFAFASELKSLVNLPDFDKTIDTKSLVSSVNYLWIPGDSSIFKNTSKLPAGHFIYLDLNEKYLQPKIERYWELKTETVNRSEKETIEIVEKKMLESISRHMVSDVPVSSFLSGGLDSSLISVIAASQVKEFSTYTIGTSEKDKRVEKMPEDEKYAKKLAEEFGFNHNEIIVDANIIDQLPDIVKTLDEPIGDPAAINTYLICDAARKKGVKVLLSGMGADEIFFGYRRQKATLLALRYQKLPAFVRLFIESIVKRLPVKIGGKGFKLARWAKRFLSFATLPADEAYMQSYSYYNSKSINRLFKEDIDKEYEQLKKEHKDLFDSNYAPDVINQICNTDISYFMQGLNLTYTDRASMAASVEVRVPFIDKEVIESAMQIQGSLKYKKRQTKYILKKVSEKHLPNDIIYRPKASFGAPIRSWIGNDLRSLVDDVLSKESVEKRNIFNYDYVKELIEKDRKGTEDHAYQIYQLLTIELWFRHYLD